MEYLDFSGIKGSQQVVKNMDLSNCNFSNTDFQYTIFEYCEIANCDFTKAKLNYVYFKKCNLESSNFEGASLKFSNFDQCVMDHTNLSNSIMNYCKLIDISIQNSGLLTDIDFSNSRIVCKEILKNINFESANFYNSYLDMEAHFCNFSKSNFSLANISGSIFLGCDFKHSLFDNAILGSKNMDLLSQ
jgi:uncharacterized protein YjbI with pentapeptide repeats